MTAPVLHTDDLVAQVIMITSPHGAGANEFTKTLSQNASLTRRLLATGALLGMQHLLMLITSGQLEATEEALVELLSRQVDTFGEEIRMK